MTRAGVDDRLYICTCCPHLQTMDLMFITNYPQLEILCTSWHDHDNLVLAALAEQFNTLLSINELWTTCLLLMIDVILLVVVNTSNTANSIGIVPNLALSI